MTLAEQAGLLGLVAKQALPDDTAYMVIVARNDGRGGSDQATATNIHDRQTIADLLRSIADGLTSGDYRVEGGKDGTEQER